MKKQVLYFLLLLFQITTYSLSAQEVIDKYEFDKTNPLFLSNDILPISLSYSIKELKYTTNDSTYMNSWMYFYDNEVRDSLDVKIRVRGNFRLKNCYFPPLKFKIKKSERKNTIFEMDKKLKLVLPCFTYGDNNDKVIEEYLAYKLYEIVSPFHFKTRLLEVDFQEEKRNKVKEHFVKGFFIEDIDEVADRYDANEIKRSVHPLAQDDLNSIRNDFFQFMIGNTDYSNAYRHNGKLLFFKGKIIPVPYDFDMSGLVDPSYGVVSSIQNEKLPINSLTERYFRGFKRDRAIFEQVRNEFLENQVRFMEILSSLEPYFVNKTEYDKSRKFLLQFFEIIADDQNFDQAIIARAREN